MRSIPFNNKQEKDFIHVVYLSSLANRIAQEKNSINTESSKLFKQAIDKAYLHQNKELLLWLNTQIGFYHYSYFNYDYALTYFLKTSRILDELKTNNFIDAENVLMKNAYFFYTIKEYQIAINYLERALLITSKQSKNYGNFLNSLGNCYYDLNNKDKAMFFFNLSLKKSKSINDTLRYAKTLGDIAKIYRDKKNFVKAESLLIEDIALSKKVKNDRNTMFAQLRLGKIYLENKQYTNAKKIITEVIDFVKKDSNLKSYYFEASLYLLPISINEQNHIEELNLRRRIDSLRPIIDTLDGNEMLKLINWKTQNEKVQWELEAQQIKSEKESLIKTAFISISCLLFCLILMLFILTKRKFKLQKSNFENSLLTAELEKLNSEKALDEANHSLNFFKSYLLEKNDQIVKLENDLKELQQRNEFENNPEQVEVENLLSSHLMTDDKWNLFKNAVIKDESEFYSEVISNYPDITESNLRIILLHKIGLNNQKIANLLGITIHGIKKAKQRMRKKYGESIDNYLSY